MNHNFNDIRPQASHYGLAAHYAKPVHASQHPDFRQLAPYAVVMDLAPTDRLTAAEGGCPLLRGSGQMISISFCPFG